MNVRFPPKSGHPGPRPGVYFWLDGIRQMFYICSFLPVVPGRGTFLKINYSLPTGCPPNVHRMHTERSPDGDRCRPLPTLGIRAEGGGPMEGAGVNALVTGPGLSYFAVKSLYLRHV